MTIKRKFVAILFFIVAETISASIIYFYFQKLKNDYLTSQTNEFKIEYNAAQNNYILMTDLFVNRTIRKPDFLRFYSNAQTNDTIRKNQIRDSLYSLLIADYKYLISKKIHNLHFHLPNNESFLRFQYPNKYGDNLSDISYLIKMTNKNNKNYFGFEKGIYSYNYKNVYPLNYKQEHIGSVEISFSFNPIKDIIEQKDSSYVNLIIRKDTLEKKLLNIDKGNYLTSSLSDNFVREPEISNEQEEEKERFIEINKQIKEKIKIPLSKNKDFSIYHKFEDKYYLISFISIKNTLGKRIAYIIKYQEKNSLAILKKQHLLVQFIGFVFYLLFSFLFYRIDLKKLIISQQYNKINTSKEDLQAKILDLNIANKKIKENEQNFKDLTNLLPIIIYEVDTSGNFLFLNNQAFESFGYNKKIFDYKTNVLQMIIAADRDRAKKNMYKILSNGTVSHTEYTAQRKDGSTFQALVYSGTIIRNDRIAGIRGAMIDISELKETENKLIEAKKEIEKSELKFRQFFEKSGDAISIVENGNLVKCNQAVVELLGYDTQEEVLNIHPSKISPLKQPDGKNSHEKMFEMYEITFKNGTHRFEWLHKKKNGVEFFAEIVLTSIITEINKKVIYAVWRDISQQKNVEQKLIHKNKELIDSKKAMSATNEKLLATTHALEENNKKLTIEKERSVKIKQQFKALFEQIPLSVQIFDKSGLAINANKAWAELWQTPIDEMVNKYNVLEDKYGKTIGTTDYLRKVFNGEIIHIPELEYDPKQSGRYGNKLTLKVIAFPIIIKGKIENVVLIHQDVTEIKKYEKELIEAKKIAQESNQLKTEFIHNMSHEIRTPMNGILGFIDFLAEPNLTETNKKNYISIIQNSGKQLMRIIDDIMEISKLETRQIKIHNKEICLNTLLLELFSIFDIKAKDNKTPLYLHKGASDTESTIYIDETKLTKILSNLLENAIKFTNKGFIEFGYNIIQTDSGSKSLQIYVKDTGIGIKEESKNTIFERFSQEEKELSKNVGGLGLGLSIAKENTELLGGKITLESKKGKGSTFFVTIPYKPVQKSIDTMTSSHRINETENQDKYTILIAEDEEINYLYLDIILSTLEQNIKTIHAKNGQEAVDICKQNSNINLVFMDLKMPVMNGFEATKQIKHFCPNLPIIAQTAYTTSEYKNKAFSTGCDAFISKPINKETLNSICDKYLKKRIN